MMMIQVHDMIQLMKTSKNHGDLYFIFYFYLDMEHDVPVKSRWLPIIQSVVLESRKDKHSIIE
jgi:hypothetical protein